MAFKLVDRVRETSTSEDEGAFTLAGAVFGAQAFSAEYAVGDTFHYAIQHQTANEWEVGFGTYSAANTLTRGTVYESSNADEAVNFSAGTKDVFVTVSGSKMVTASDSQAARRVIGYNPVFSGVNGFCFGHSNGQQGGTGPQTRYPERIRRTLELNTMSNRTLSGSTMAGVSGAINCGLAGQTTAWTQGTYGLVTINAVGNDSGAYYYGGAAHDISAYKDDLRTSLRLLRAKAKYADPHASISKAFGSWSTEANSYLYTGASAAMTTQAGAYANISFSGDEIVIVTTRETQGTAMGTWEFLSDADSYSSVIGELYCGGGHSVAGDPAILGRYLLSHRLTGFGAGNHTLRCRKKAGESNKLVLDSWLDMDGAKAPCVVVVKDYNVTWAGYWVNGSDAVHLQFNNALEEVVNEAEFLTYCRIADSVLWGADKSTSAWDGIHANDRGQAEISSAIVDALVGVDFREGINEMAA